MTTHSWPTLLADYSRERGLQHRPETLRTRMSYLRRFAATNRPDATADQVVAWLAGHEHWTPATRKNYSRKGLRYQSDVTDEEWRVIEPYLPPAKDIGRPRAGRCARSSMAFST